MIQGTVNANYEAIISVVVQGTASAQVEVEAIVDTGFNGHLSLPPAVITLLNLSWQGRGSAILGDGSSVLFDIYDATVEWDGEARQISVDGANGEPLAGMALLDGYELMIQVTPAGKVMINPLPQASA